MMKEDESKSETIKARKKDGKLVRYRRVQDEGFIENPAPINTERVRKPITSTEFKEKWDEFISRYSEG